MAHPSTPSWRPSMPLLALLAGSCAVVGLVMATFADSVLAGAAFVVAAIGFAALPAIQRRRARRISAVAGAGRPATARIVNVQALRARGGVRRVRVHYEIRPEGREPYRLTTRHVVPPGLDGTFVAGNVISVRVDPADPKNVVFVTGGP